MRVLAFAKYDRQAASTRHRMLAYAGALGAAEITLDVRALLSNDYVQALSDGRHPARAPIAAAYLRRMLSRPRDADIIWIYAELFPYLPMMFEGLAHRTGLPVVYDWDDAFSVPYERHRSPIVRHVAGKFPRMLSRAAAVTCGNQWVRDYCLQFCSNSILLPTVVGTDVYRPLPRSDGARLRLGWIGSPSTWPNVRPLLPMIDDFCRSHDATFRVIGAGKAAAADRFDCLDLVEWSEDSEVAEVQAMDIGLMPLLDGPFERGKSGFKLVQYMACGVPVVAAPVGANRHIVSHGINGFLATSNEEWRTALTVLAADADLRRRMGGIGRQMVEEEYSIAAQAPRLIALFRELAG